MSTTTAPALTKTMIVHPSKVQAGDVVIPVEGREKTVAAVGRLADAAIGESDVIVAYEGIGAFGVTAPVFHTLVGDRPNGLMKPEFALKASHAAIQIRRTFTR